MKVAFIPPQGLYHHMRNGNMVMALAQFADEDAYASVVRAMHARDKFVIMDNGANEQAVFSNQELANRAARLRADEIVLPDVLGDMKQTLELVRDYLQDVIRADVVYPKAQPKHMAVTQGENIDEVKSIIDAYADTEMISTLGLPRLLLKKLNQRSVRLDLANWVDYEYPGRFEIHLLGASSEWVKEPFYVRKYAPHVRSIDTSLPYNYGLVGVRLEDSDGTTTLRIDRPENYFSKIHEATARTTISSNEEVYKSWCSVTR